MYPSSNPAQGVMFLQKAALGLAVDPPTIPVDSNILLEMPQPSSMI